MVRMPRAAAESAKILPRLKTLRSVAAKPHDSLTFNVFAREVIVVGERRIQAVAYELNLIRSQGALSADVGGKGNAFFVVKSASLAAGFDGNCRAIVALDPEHR